MEPSLHELLDGVVAQIQLMNLKGVKYDSDYFPPYTQVKKISLDTGPARYYQPGWLDFVGEKSYELIEVDGGSLNNLYFEIFSLSFHKVEKIINPYLERAFELKKSKSNGASQMILYHATIPENIDSICKNNFNWRLYGQSRGSKHGQGVSFSPYPGFANRFCKSIFNKRIIVTQVLYKKSNIGSQGDPLPADGYDTTRSPNGNVFVKFEDNEFLPIYVVHYN